MMDNEFLLLTKKHSDTLIEQTKTKPQETLEMNLPNQGKISHLPNQNTFMKKGNGN